ncbi:MAG: hypothetical protein AAGA96_01720 [Verrucomicrobiota bacterium]
MKLASVVFLALVTFFSLPSSLPASEAASDCESAVEIFESGVESRPGDLLIFYLDALRTNPGCRRSLLISALNAAKGDDMMMRWVIFTSRQEFPEEMSMMAEAALSAAPEYNDLIREAFVVDRGTVSSELAQFGEAASLGNLSMDEVPSQLVELPEETQQLDEELREAIARMTAKVEGKMWPEQEVEEMDISYRQRDELRVSKTRISVDEGSLENQLPFDSKDERKHVREQIVIDDHPYERSDFRLDESKFAKGSQMDSRVASEVRKRELAPAGSVGLPQGPKLPRSSVYYIAPASGDYQSTIDLDLRSEPRPTLVIRSAPAVPTDLR